MSPSGKKVPGAYINLGNGKASAPVHNDRYDFSEEDPSIRDWAPLRTRMCVRYCRAPPLT